MNRIGTWLVVALNSVAVVASGFDAGVLTVAGSIVAMWLATR